MSQNLIWTLQHQHTLQRKFELLFARTPDPKHTAQMLCDHFRREVQSHPVEWPSSSRPPLEHTWQFGRVSVRYRDRKSTRLNSSHTVISYAVFCLKKKTQFCSLSHN